MRLADVYVAVKTDLTQFRRGLGELNRTASASATSVGKSLQVVGRGMQGVGSSMTASLTLPLVAIGAATSKFAMDFESSFAQIEGLVGIAGDELDDLREGVLALSGETAKSPTELADALYFITSAGLSGKDAMDALTLSARASAGGLGDVNTIADTVTSAMNAYGSEVLSAEMATDVLIAAVREGKTPPEDLAGAFGKVLPIASAMGVEFHEVGAALAGMSRTGTDAANASTQLRQILATILAPTTEAIDALRGVGLTVEDLQSQLRDEGLLATLQTLKERFGDNAAATQVVFGNIRALSGVLDLLGGNAEDNVSVFERLSEAGGETAKAFEIAAETSEFKLKQSLADLQVVAIEVGNEVLPAVLDVLKGLADGAREFGKWWGSLSKETKGTIVQLTLFVAVAGPLIKVIGLMTSGLGGLLRMIGFLGGAKGIPSIITGMGRLGMAGAFVIAGIALAHVTGLVRDFVHELTMSNDELKEFNDLMALGVEDKFAGILMDMGVSVKQFSLVLAAADGDAEAAFRAISDNSGSTARAIGELLAASGDLVDDTQWAEWERNGTQSFKNVSRAAEAEAIRAVLIASGIAPDMAEEVLQSSGVLGDAAEEAMDPIAEAAAKAREMAIDHMESMLSGIVGLFESDEDVQKAFQDLLDRMDDPYTEAERKADVFSMNMLTVIKTALASDDPGAVGGATELVNRLLREFALIEPGALESGDAVPPAIRAGMDSQMDALIDYLEEEVGIILDGMTLEEAREIGVDGILRYAQGMEFNQWVAENAARATRNAALKLLQEGVEPAGRYGAATGAGFGTAIRARPNLENARTAGDELGRKARDAMKVDASGAGNSVAWSFVNAIANTIKSGSAASKIQQASQLLKTKTLGGSLPTDGPFAHPETGAKSIGEAWTAGLVDAINKAVPDVKGAVGQVADSLVMQPSANYVEQLRNSDLIPYKEGESRGEREERLAIEVVKLRDLLGIPQPTKAIEGETHRQRAERLAQEALQLRKAAAEAGVSLAEAVSKGVSSVAKSFIEQLRNSELIPYREGESRREREERLAVEVVKLRDLLGLAQPTEVIEGETHRQRAERLAMEALRLRAAAEDLGLTLTSAVKESGDRLEDCVCGVGRIAQSYATQTAFGSLQAGTTASSSTNAGLPTTAPVGSNTYNVSLLDKLEVRSVEDIGHGLRRLGDMGKLPGSEQ